MRISKFLLNVFCLSFVCAGVSAQESQEPQYFMTDGTEITKPNELVTGYYIINAVGPNHRKKGLLCWNSSSSPSSFGIDTQKPYKSLTDQLLSTTEDVCKYIFYIEKVNETDFKIKSVQGGQYMSKSNAPAAEKLTYVQSTPSGNDVANFTLVFEYNGVSNVNIPFKVGGKDVEHFIVKLANATTSKKNPVFLHSQPVATVLPLSFYKGYNATGGTCSKLAFFKLSPKEVVNFTYEYIVNEETVKTEKHKEVVGQPYPAIAKIHDYWKVTTNIPGENGEKVSDKDKDRIFQVKVEWDGPFNLTESEESLDNANWYHLNFTPSRKVITNQGEKETIPVRTATSTSTVSSRELWAFVGNPFDGFKIYNAYKSNDVYGRLVTPNNVWTDGKKVNPYVSYKELEEGTSDVWTISDPTSYDENKVTVPNSFFIGYQFNENKVYNLNFNSDYLSFWTNGQGDRSAFTVNQNVTGPLDKQIVFKSGGDNYYYSTFYIDYPVQVKSDYIEVYTGTLDEVNGILQMTKSTDNIIPAHTGVILRMHKNDFDANANHSYALTNASPMLQQASLSGTIEEILLNEENRHNYLVFGKSGGNLGFYTPSSKVTSIAPYKAFLNWSTSMSVRAFKLVFDETTSIDASTIFGDEENGLSPQAPIYDLSGRRVQHTTRGIYIQNGKKVFVK